MKKVMKILITGGTGFVGQHVTRDLLKEGAEVAVLTRNRDGLKNLDTKKIKIIEGSLESLTECGKHIKSFDPDICIHLAWSGIPDYSQEVSKKNLDQSKSLIDFLLEETNCKKIISSGSCFEYGTAGGELPETTQEENISPIAWAKNSLKDYLALRCNEKDLSWIWLRIFYVYGPGQRTNSLIPTLYRAASMGTVPHIQNPNNANDFVYISDVSDAISIASHQNVESGVYNIGSGYLSSVSDMWTLVQRYANPAENRTETTLTTHSTEKNKSSAIKGYASIKKAKAKLNWEPKIAVEKGVKEFIAYLSDQGKT